MDHKKKKSRRYLNHRRKEKKKCDFSSFSDSGMEEIVKIRRVKVNSKAKRVVPKVKTKEQRVLARINGSAPPPETTLVEYTNSYGMIMYSGYGKTYLFGTYNSRDNEFSYDHRQVRPGYGMSKVTLYDLKMDRCGKAKVKIQYDIGNEYNWNGEWVGSISTGRSETYVLNPRDYPIYTGRVLGSTIPDCGDCWTSACYVSSVTAVVEFAPY